jgi:hypothetical protein
MLKNYYYLQEATLLGKEGDHIYVSFTWFDRSRS